MKIRIGCSVLIDGEIIVTYGFEKHGGLLKNADLVIGSIAKFQEQIEEEERQCAIERRWQRFEEMNDNKKRRIY